MSIYSLTQDLIKSSFTYCPNTGDFHRMHHNRNPNEDGTCGRIDKRGNKVIDFKGQTYPASAMAWIYMTGEIPPKSMMIYYKNSNNMDLRFHNLYLAPRSFSQIGVSKRGSNNKLPTGVTEHRYNKNTNNVSYTAAVMYNYRRIGLGSFATAKRAEKAYKAAIDELSSNGTITISNKDKSITHTFT